MTTQTEAASGRTKRKRPKSILILRVRLNVEGVEYWVSAWKRKPDASPNAPALSFSVKLKEAKPPIEQPAPDVNLNDDIPF